MQTNEILKNLSPIEIQKYQQNRYPCFFVDCIEEIVPGKYAKGYKNFTYNEWFFPAHFEDEPNVPGSIQVETLAQVFLMTFLSFKETKNLKTAVISHSAKFTKKIMPGDKLNVIAELKSYKRGLATGIAKGYVDNILACSVNFIIAIPDILNKYKPKNTIGEKV